MTGAPRDARTPDPTPAARPGLPRLVDPGARRAAVEFGADFPQDLVALVEPHVMRWLHLAPGWVQLLHVTYDHAGDAGTAARMTTLVQYRKAVLYIQPAWHMESDLERAATIRHELFHITVEPLAEAAMAGIRHLKKENPQAYKLAKRGVDLAVEGVVTDLALAVGDVAPRDHLRPPE